MLGEVATKEGSTISTSWARPTPVAIPVNSRAKQSVAVLISDISIPDTLTTEIAGISPRRLLFWRCEEPDYRPCDAAFALALSFFFSLPRWRLSKVQTTGATTCQMGRVRVTGLVAPELPHHVALRGRAGFAAALLSER